MSATSLRSSAFQPRRVFLTGASGYLGGLIAAQLLARSECELVVPLRPSSSAEGFRSRLSLELAALGYEPDALQARVHVVSWSGAEGAGSPDWDVPSVPEGIDEIIHCAGCLDYYDLDALNAVNVELTTALLRLGKRWGVSRFTYVSTAFSSGYVDGVVAERLHEEPPADPTAYTRTKRRAEHIVAQSGLPWLVMRPSILIGESVSGRYSGKRYGVYQQWMGLERLMCDRYHADMHTVAPEQALNMLHQDAFQTAFGHAHAWMPDNAVINLVSDDAVAPTMRSVWALWMEVVRPQRVFYYPRFEDVDLKAINLRQRAYLTFAQVNLEIGAHPWHFENAWLRRLQAHGLEFNNATLETTARCLHRFVDTSEVLTAYLERFRDELPQSVEYINLTSKIERASEIRN